METKEKLETIAKINDEEKSLKAEIKTKSALLETKTKDIIENLSDEQASELLKAKWIIPLIQNIMQLPDRIIKELVANIELLEKKYETTFEEIENEITETEKVISGMIDELEGSESDMLGLKELKNYWEVYKMTKENGKPQIRFAKFKDTWEQRKLGELSSSFEYGLNAAAKEYDGENKYIRITDIDDDSREFKQEDITSPDTDLSSAENYRLSEGDILFARTGASVGKSYIYKVSDGLVYYAGFLIRARIMSEYNAEFVFQNTLTYEYEKFIKVTSMRSGQPGVNAQEYSKYQIMVPSKPEQDKISDCFRSLDNLITLHQRKYDKLTKAKKSMLEKMFPKNGTNVPEIRFKGFTDAWEQRKLGEMMEVTSVKRIHQSDWTDSGVRFLRARDIVAESKKRMLVNLYLYRKKNTMNIVRCQVK